MASSLFWQIARCDLVDRCFAGQPGPCAPVIGVQRVATRAEFQVPEPWNGDLASACMLFLASNPSIDPDEEYPDGRWPDDRVEDFFLHRFGGGQRQWVRDGRVLRKDGTYAPNHVKYWAEVRSRAAETLGRARDAVVAGRDYALSEVVHCKSRRREGVAQAFDTCTQRYLAQLIASSAARAVFWLGDEAEKAARRIFSLSPGRRFYRPADVPGAGRYFIFTAAPGSSKPRTLGNVLEPAELQELRAAILAYVEAKRAT